ncbi:phosphate ABC transporter substrate-binding protein (PhoT family) [Fluviicoccus keumensis]|uniref:Phosphate-binding protein PstS n=1 Tax=Fluviicoccus keumensis TaxID=1435465 RepID=A0A4Q7Z615_9GAMM|nr:phosphate ABC transporter substrate-binding protein PstS [Fluviicoccus keumensis]RZU45109.1 phosphate ABC transporter substrate-binding protein (PhoT family) [Fluviicoccus keumensis]
MRNLFLNSAALMSAIACSAVHADITGAGSTFAYPIFAKWADSYKKENGVGLNYQAIGSGGGIKQITEKTVDFGASDMPLTKEDLEAKGLTQFPAIMGGVVPVVNLSGIGPGQMRMTGPVLADIYLGKIKQWNDPAIAALNPTLKLPEQNIVVVRRADGSGTTFIFTNYLSKVSEEWKSKVGSSTAVSWPEGVAGKANAGVASYVQRIDGAIGYVEYAYAKTAKMAYTQMQNKAGAYVLPDDKTFQAAAAYADWAHAPAFYEVLTNEPGATSWPITGATFVLLQKKAEKGANTQQVMKFFDWSFRKGGAQAAQLDYVPMPENVVKLIETSWKTEVHDLAGAPVWK